MKEENSLKDKNEDINLKEIVSFLYDSKWYGLLFGTVFGIGSLYFSLKLPDIYLSEVTLNPRYQDSMTGVQGQLGGLAELAGVNLTNGTPNKSTISLEILKSRSFLLNFIEKNRIKPEIYASTNWQKDTNQLVYDDEKYNKNTNQWLVGKAPDDVLIVNKLLNSLIVKTDKTTGIIKISYSHYSPSFTKYILESLIKELNFVMKEKEIDEINKNIKNLEYQLEKTNVKRLKDIIYSVIEDQTRKLLLMNSNEEFIFETIDKAYIPNIKAGPKRSVIVAGCTLIGILFGIVVFSIKRKTYKSR